MKDPNKAKTYTISIFEHCTATDHKVNRLAAVFKKFDLKFSDYLWLFNQFADGKSRKEYWID